MQSTGLFRLLDRIDHTFTIYDMVVTKVMPWSDQKVCHLDIEGLLT